MTRRRRRAIRARQTLPFGAAFMGLLVLAWVLGAGLGLAAWMVVQ